MRLENPMKIPEGNLIAGKGFIQDLHDVMS
jgi:hypothetical protein